jgi:predicted MFS family arabinose efflux permease
LLSRIPMLAVRDGRLFLIAQALDALAIGLSLVALPWLVLQNGGSQAEAGLVFSVSVLPYVVFGLIAGAVGDRFPRRAVMLCGHVAQAACAAVIPIWTVAGTPPVGVVLAAAFAVGAGRVFVDAAAFGAVASIVGAESFVEGQSALSAAWSLGLFAGPALGGALVAAIGPGRALAAEASALALAALMIGAIRTSFAHRSEPAGSGAVREGVRFMFRNRGIVTYTAITVVWNLVGAGAFALLVPLLRDGMGLTSGAVGTILGLGSLVTLVASLWATTLSRSFGGARVLSACLLVSPIAIAGLGVVDAFGSALVVALGYYVIVGLLSVIAIAERQRRAPEQLQARVGIAGRMILLGATASGAALASALTGPIGVAHLYLLMGAATLLVGAAATPLLLRLDR